MTTLDGYEAGDTARLRLTVVPDGGVPPDGTTVATLALTAPDGAALTPEAEPDDDTRTTWSALVTDLQAGAYTGAWTVIGTGAGRQAVELLVAPAPGGPGGRSYATTAQLAEHLQAAPPSGAARLLARATSRVDELLRTAVYDVTGPDELPVDPGVAAALAEATCAQAAWMVDLGDEDGSGLALRYSDVQIGSVRMTSGRREPDGAVQGDDGRYAPAAVEALRKVPELYGAAPWIPW